MAAVSISVFPHHENELAQSCCAFHSERMANVWMHNGFLQVEGEKMSKSLGNFITIRQLLNDWPGEVLRFNMLRTHYRQPIDWTMKGLEESSKVLDRWYATIGDTKPADAPDAAFVDALADDLNTPAAITRLHQLEGEGAALKASAMLIGLLATTASERKSTALAETGADKTAIEKLIADRKTARAAKDFKESDRIRDELAAMGVTLKDGKDPKTGELTTSWEIAR
jgi:cysteinyl-tRNA synthetase